MLFAEIDAQGWVIIIIAVSGGIGGIVTPIVGMVIGFYRDKAKAKREDEREDAKIRRDAEVAKKVVAAAVIVAGHAEEVKTTLADNVAHTVSLNERVEQVRGEVKEVRGEVKEVHKLVNGVNEKMGAAREAKGREEGHAAGVIEQSEQTKIEHRPGDDPRNK